MQKRRWIALVLVCCVIVIGSILVLTQQAPQDKPAPDTNASANTNKAAPAALSGVVVGFDGTPIPGAAVTAGDQRAVADDAGRFAFQALPAGPLVVDASAEGWVSPGPDSMRGRRVTISQDAPLAGVELPLRRPAQLAGRVVGPAGQPIADAKLGLYYVFADGMEGPLAPFSLEGVAQTSPQGGFTLDAIAPGRVRVLVEAQGFALATSREVFLRDGQALQDLTITVGDAHTLKLTVLNTSGDVIPDASVALRGPGIMGAATLSLDARGVVSREGLGEGIFVVEARAPGYGVELAEVEIVAGEAVITHDLVLEPARGIFGRVEDSRGQPVAGAALQLTCDDADNNNSTWTDPAGEFAFEDAAGTCQAQAFSINAAPSPMTSLSAGTPAALTLGVGATLVGRVVDSAGQPVPSYQLVVESFDAAEGPPLFHASSFPRQQISRADGRFELGPVMPGTFTLRAAPRGMPHAMSEPVSVTAGQRSGEITITVARGGKVAGVVRDDQGNPVAGAQVAVFDTDGSAQHGSATTDARGAYIVEGVTTGRRSVRASASGYVTQIEGGVVVESDRTATRDIKLTKAGPDARYAFHGVGAVLNKENDRVTIQSLVDGSPAAAVGLKEGDSIISVDGEQTGPMSLTQIVERIRGEEGVNVRVEIEREGEGRRVVEITRGRVVVRDGMPADWRRD
jgi:protocatechuate 3,4-dioxygenase beta subunit